MDGRNTGRMGFSHAAEDSAENMMAAVKAGKIRKHLMGNTSPIRYGTMENYIAAKAKIFKNQTPEDYCVLNYDNEIVRELEGQEK